MPRLCILYYGDSLMNKKLFKTSIYGFIFVSIIGTLCHFVFELSGYSRIAGLLCPVNESSWEHLKMLFFPYLVWSIAEYVLLKKDKGIFFSKAIGAVSGMLSILIIFYTYTGIIGKNSEILNILSYYIGVFTSFAVDYSMIKSMKFSTKSYNAVGIFILIFITALFFLFTFFPPLIPLFKDPISSSYGL